MIVDDLTLISVEQAKCIVSAYSKPLPTIKVPILEATFLTLAEEVFAPCDVPAYRQSAMDGYALKFADYAEGNTLFVENEMAAGEHKHIQLKQNQAVRIFTGAAMPESADTVVIQEKVQVGGNQLNILNRSLQLGDNVRAQGSEICEGAIAMNAGEYLTPGSIGFLASIGVAEVFVYPRPRIHLIITGKELQKPGELLLHGQVYEANSYSLMAALLKFHFKDVVVHFAEDKLADLQYRLQVSLGQADLVLLTGGVSMGDYDFVIEAAKHCGVDQLFHKIKQKPGKPMYFGMKGQTPVFGLPGNPSSVLTCFYEYVLPSLANICQQNELLLPVRHKKLTKSVAKKDGLTCFLKGYYYEDEVDLLGAQESFRLSSFALANCLVCLRGSKNIYQAGEIVEIHIIH